MTTFNGTNQTNCDDGYRCRGTPTGCNTCLAGEFGVCSGTAVNNNGAMIILTSSGGNTENKGNYDGTTRSLEGSIGVASHLNNSVADHVAVFSTAHPNCHGEVEAVLSRPANYSLTICVPDVPPFGHEDEFPECGQTAIGCLPGVDVSFFVPESSAPGRFKLKIESALDSNQLLNATATITDTQTSDFVRKSSTPLATPLWYASQAKRFGFGGQRTSSSFPARWDDLVASAGC